MSGHAVRSNSSPLTCAQLIWVPLYGAFSAAMSTLCYSKMLSDEALLMLWLALSGTQVGLGAWVAYRSDYATRHGLVASILGLLFVAPLAAGVTVIALSMAGAQELSNLAIVSVAGSMLLTVAWTLWRQLQQLVREGPAGLWVRDHVDADAGRIRADTLVRGAGDAPSWKAGLAIAFGVNLPLIYQSWGVTDNQAMPVILIALLSGSVWLCAAVFGPMAGKALYLRRLERAAGRRFFHEAYDELQTLRRGFWLSRLLMVDADGGPASTGAPDAAPAESLAQRLRRYAVNALYTLAFSCLLAGVMGFFLLGWPSVQQALYFDGFRPAEVVVSDVAIAGRSPKWVGRGQVDGADVDFGPGDLDHLIGTGPQRRDDPQLIALRARLPIRAELLWNPQLQRRLLPLGTKREVVEASAWFFAGGTGALTGLGVLLLWLAGRVAPSDNSGIRKQRQTRGAKP